MFYQLPPAGDTIRLSEDGSASSLPGDLFYPYTSRYYESGTAALAAAIRAAIAFKGVDTPEVILPAYGCPDLVSATIFAGARPVLVDLECDRPWMDSGQLAALINQHTAAIVAVDLFGIPERLETLRKIADRGSVILIEDSAQAFPLTMDKSFWRGDLVVLSFGRGKPVTLLGGGAVLFREPALGNRLPEVADQHAAGWSFWLQAMLYNLMSSPHLYWIAQGLPFLHLGETRYRPLRSIGAMEATRVRLLLSNIHKYQCDTSRARAAMTDLMKSLRDPARDLVDLPVVCGLQPQQRLLRYPLLVDPGRRGELFRRLHQAGLGPSLMYPTSLPGIPGLEGVLEGQGDYPVAEAFARSILTLPVHDRVRSEDIRKAGEILRSAYGRNFN